MTESVPGRSDDTRSVPAHDALPAPVLDGKVALVTGASSGLGFRFARLLQAAGAQVVATARRSDLLDELASGAGSPIATLPGDITSPAHRSAIAGWIGARLGRLDVLVNNAGASDGGPLESQDLAEITRVIDLNLVSVIDLCRLCAPLLFASPSASVVNVSSIYGLVASRGPMAAYNASKGAIISFTRHLAAQWGPRGVRVNALAPGYFPTDLTGHLSGPDLVESIRERTLLGRVPELTEIDGPLLFLASDASSYVTGQVLVVDGGWTAA